MTTVQEKADAAILAAHSEKTLKEVMEWGLPPYVRVKLDILDRPDKLDVRVKLIAETDVSFNLFAVDLKDEYPASVLRKKKRALRMLSQMLLKAADELDPA